MVFIQYKKNEKNSFIIEVEPYQTVRKVIERLLEIQNLRIYVDRLSKMLQQLATKGVLKPQQLQGLSPQDISKHWDELKDLEPQKLKYAKKPIPEPPYRYVFQKSHNRYGLILPQDQTQILQDSVTKAKKELQPRNTVTTTVGLLTVIDQMRDAVMITYPGYYGLPDWQPVVLILQNKLDYDMLATEQFQHFQPQANLWWAGKQLQKSKQIGQYTGKNLKTRITVKLQNVGAPQPPREPPVDTETYRQMIQYYQKKQKENKDFDKQLVTTYYENPEWANKKLKEDLTMGKQITYKPF